MVTQNLNFEGDSRHRGRASIADDEIIIEIMADDVSRPLLLDRLAERIRLAIQTTYQALTQSPDVQVRRARTLEDEGDDQLVTVLRVEFGDPFDRNGPYGGENGRLKFLARGMLTLVRWLAEPERSGITGLGQALKVLANGTAADFQSGFAAPNPASLSMAVGQWQDAQRNADLSGTVRLRTHLGGADLDLLAPIGEADRSLPVKKLRNPATDMIFIVEMPDYQSTGEWLLRHGSTKFAAACEPCDLIGRFHRREVDIRPGDGMHCRVEFETSYGPDHEVVSEHYKVVDVVALFPRGGVEAAKPPAPRIEVSEPMSDEFCEEVEGDFGLLTIRRIPIH